MVSLGPLAGSVEDGSELPDLLGFEALDVLLEDEELASVFDAEPQPARARPKATTATAVPHVFKGNFMQSPGRGERQPEAYGRQTENARQSSVLTQTERVGAGVSLCCGIKAPCACSRRASRWRCARRAASQRRPCRPRRQRPRCPPKTSTQRTSCADAPNSPPD